MGAQPQTLPGLSSMDLPGGQPCHVLPHVPDFAHYPSAFSLILGSKGANKCRPGWTNLQGDKAEQIVSL